MKTSIMYVELKSGYQDNGPAWIGKVAYSKTMRTLYFMNKAFKKFNNAFHPYGNYMDPETGEVYWISGVKKNGEDRHWAGSGKVMVDRRLVDEYLQLTGRKSLDESKYIITDIVDAYPVDRIRKLENREKRKLPEENE